jgi:hypothetical protein
MGLHVTVTDPVSARNLKDFIDLAGATADPCLLASVTFGRRIRQRIHS